MKRHCIARHMTAHQPLSACKRDHCRIVCAVTQRRRNKLGIMPARNAVQRRTDRTIGSNTASHDKPFAVFTARKSFQRTIRPRRETVCNRLLIACTEVGRVIR